MARSEARADEPLREQEPPDGTDGEVDLGADPDRRALEDRQLPDVLRQFGQRVPLDQVAIAQELADGHRRGLDEADAVLGEGRLVAHEPHRRFLLTGAGANQRGPHIVI